MNVGWGTSRIFDHIVTGWRYRALRHFLRDQEKVESFIQSHFVVDHSAATGVGRAAAVHFEETRVDPLADDDKGDAWIVIRETRFGSSLATRFLLIITIWFNKRTKNTLSFFL